MAKKPGLLDPLRIRIRRLQLILGIGLLACVLGALLTIPISFRVLPGLEPGSLVFELARTLISQLWVYAVLPAVWYGVARIVEVRPRSAAVGSTLTGMLFQLAIALISTGLDGLLEAPPVHLALWALTGVAGAFVTGWAIRAARAASKRAEEEARRAAEARRDEYAEFARAAEQSAARIEAREAEGPPAQPETSGPKSA